MGLGLPCCFGGNTIQTLKLASIPSRMYSSSPSLRSSPVISRRLTLLETLTVTLSRNSTHRFPFLIRALSSAAPAAQSVVDSTTTASVNYLIKPQWKAAIDFKSIIENKSAVAANINNRNSNANLELVIDLYERLLELQKVRVLSIQLFKDGSLFAFRAVNELEK